MCIEQILIMGYNILSSIIFQAHRKKKESIETRKKKYWIWDASSSLCFLSFLFWLWLVTHTITGSYFGGGFFYLVSLMKQILKTYLLKRINKSNSKPFRSLFYFYFFFLFLNKYTKKFKHKENETKNVIQQKYSKHKLLNSSDQCFSEKKNINFHHLIHN